MNSIIRMKHAMGNAEYIRDVQDKEYKRRLVAKNLALEICAQISKYFSVEMWDAWCDASPDDEYEFLAYAEAEAQNCLSELYEDDTDTKELARVSEWLDEPATVADAQNAAYGALDLEQLDRMQHEQETQETRRTDYPI